MQKSATDVRTKMAHGHMRCWVVVTSRLETHIGQHPQLLPQPPVTLTATLREAAQPTAHPNTHGLGRLVGFGCGPLPVAVEVVEWVLQDDHVHVAQEHRPSQLKELADDLELHGAGGVIGASVLLGFGDLHRTQWCSYPVRGHACLMCLVASSEIVGDRGMKKCICFVCGLQGLEVCCQISTW